MSQKEVPKKMGETKFLESELHDVFIILNKDPCPTVKIGQICHIQYSTKTMIPLGRLEFIIPKINFDNIYIYIVVNMKYFLEQFHQEI
jgi:hypothetical protein